MDRRRQRWPWEKDPNDRELNYRRPVPRHERLRLALKGGAAIVAALWFRSKIGTGQNEGAALAVAFGGVIAFAGLVDLVAAAKGRLEQIFLPNRNAQMIVQAVLLIAGLSVLVAGAVRLP